MSYTILRKHHNFFCHKKKTIFKKLEMENIEQTFVLDFTITYKFTIYAFQNFITINQ